MTQRNSRFLSGLLSSPVGSVDAESITGALLAMNPEDGIESSSEAEPKPPRDELKYLKAVS